MNIRFIVRTYLNQQRFEVFLAVLMPFFLIVESGVANAWVYAGGSFDLHTLRTYIALARGLFFEVLTYSSAKLARLLWRKHNWVGVLITTAVAVWAIVVSAGNNLGWVLSGGDLGGMLAAVGHYLPRWFDLAYQLGLGVLLPLAVGGLALVDVEHLVHEILATAHLDNKAVQVREAEMHRTEYLKSQEKQRPVIREAYDRVAGNRTQQFIARVERGDMSFGADELAALPSGPAARRLNGPAALAPGLPAGGTPAVPGMAAPARPMMPPAAPGSPMMPGGAALPAQMMPPPAAPTGSTQPIVVPPPPHGYR
jgi:hypothetical protein